MKKIFLFSYLFFYFLNFSHAQPGETDPSFGNNGIVITGMGSNFEYGSLARQVLIRTDGSIYIILDAGFITKRLSNGSIDAGYGFNGYSRSVPLIQSCGALQPDGKIVIAGSYNNNSFGVARINTNGTADSTFGNNGIEITEFGGYSHAGSVAIQADGKIVVAGNTANNNGTYFAVARYNTNGKADKTFNGSGQTLTAFDSSLEVVDNNANALVIQADGKILVGGYTNTGTHHAFAVARYNTTGSLDNTFDGDGRQTTNVGSYDDAGYSLAMQNDGKIILAGYTSDGAVNHFALVRYTANGSPDKSFNGNGRQTAPPGSDVIIGNSVVIQNDGKIVVAGNTLHATGNDFAIARFNVNGSADSSFDNDGIQTTGFISSNGFAGSVVLQSDNKIVVAGYTNSYSPAADIQRFALTRYNTNGSLDNSFGTDGRLQGDYKQGDTRFTASAIQSDGKILTAGVAWNGSQYDFAVARYNTNGSPDKTFSNDGKQLTQFGSSVDNVHSIVVQKDGKIIIAGSSNNQFALARYTASGSADNTFNGNGKLITSTGFADFGQSIALQSDGKIVMAGYSFIDGNYDSAQFAVVRFNSNGTFDNTFSGDGKQLTGFGSSQNFATSVAIQNDGKIVVAGRALISNVSNFCLARYNTDGSPDNNFSHDGKQNSVFGPDDYFIESIAIQKDGKILAAGYSVSPFPNSYSFVIARYNASGDLDNTFGKNGFRATSPGRHLNLGTSVAILDDGRIAVGGTNDNYTIVLYKKDGTPDSTFDNDGIKISNIGTGESLIQSLAVADNKLYAVGNARFPGYFGVVARYLLAQASPLPVSLVNFEAEGQKTSVLLRWQTASEENLSLFIIQRSGDGNVFSSIDSVHVAATTMSTVSYSTPDTHPLNGVNFYRLKMTDADGKFSYSKIVAVNIKENISALEVFPNPAKNILYVQASGENEKAMFQIIDATGRKTKEVPVTLIGKTAFSIPINTLAKGIYNLKLYKKTKVETRVFIKQ